MLTHYFEKALQQLSGLQKNGLSVSRAVHRAVLRSGKPGRAVADLLHGTWLGHPLHPMLTDVTVGAWTLGALFDAVAATGGERYARQAADALTAVGTASAAPTALSGLADFSTAQKPAVSTASLHAITNVTAVALYLCPLRDRRRGNRRRGLFFSVLGMGLATTGAWLGGHLVYGHRVGVDHSEARTGPTDWTPALGVEELEEGEPTLGEANGKPILLYRTEGRICAIDAVCSHAGGPLDEGDFADGTVRCPWHDSVFGLCDGRVMHGPATRPQPSFATRVRDGQVEIRLSQG